jgi:hypothetical protein
MEFNSAFKGLTNNMDTTSDQTILTNNMDTTSDQTVPYNTEIGILAVVFSSRN